MSFPQRPRTNPSEFAAAVQDYYAHKTEDYDPEFDKFLDQHKFDPNDKHEPSKDTKRQEILEQLIAFQERTGQIEPRANRIKMPANDEDHAPGDLTDQVAKDSKDSTASTHDRHDVDTGAKGGSGAVKANYYDHTATPGPVMTDNMPKAESKEALQKRAEELNK